MPLFFPGAARQDIEERSRISGYAEIHGDILPVDQAHARQRKHSGVLTGLKKKIGLCAMMALHEIR